MPPRDQVCVLTYQGGGTAVDSVFEGCYTTSEDTKTCARDYPVAILYGRLLIPDGQITCLYDMDIVFQPNGNFDEVYLYVSDR